MCLAQSRAHSGRSAIPGWSRAELLSPWQDRDLAGRLDHEKTAAARSEGHGCRSWAAEGPDLFKALRALRRVLDPLGIRLGVNGARRDAWASGMQCDMGEGRVVYLLAEGHAGRPEQVSTLGPTPVSRVGTVDDQDQQHEQWLRSRRTAN